MPDRLDREHTAVDRVGRALSFLGCVLVGVALGRGCIAEAMVGGSILAALVMSESFIEYDDE